jgi:hypothetical protein
MDNVEKVLKNYEDFWARHNLTSRISIFIFVSIYLFSVIFILLNPINAPLAQVILNTTSYIALLSILVVILGPNTFVKIAQIYTDKKFKDLSKKQIDNINSNIIKPSKDL